MYLAKQPDFPVRIYKLLDLDNSGRGELLCCWNRNMLKQVLVFQGLGFQLPASSKCWKILENTKIVFWTINTYYMCLSLPAGKHYPMYATQFHPEKNNMMWSVKAKLNHTQLAVQMSQYFANFFVAEGMTPVPCITNAIWRYRKTFSQRENCFQQQKRCHWFEGLGQCQIAV